MSVYELKSNLSDSIEKLSKVYDEGSSANLKDIGNCINDLKISLSIINNIYHEEKNDNNDLSLVEKIAVIILDPQLSEIYLHGQDVLGWRGTDLDTSKKPYIQDAFSAAERLIAYGLINLPEHIVDIQEDMRKRIASDRQKIKNLEDELKKYRDKGITFLKTQP